MDECLSEQIILTFQHNVPAKIFLVFFLKNNAFNTLLAHFGGDIFKINFYCKKV